MADTDTDISIQRGQGQRKEIKTRHQVAGEQAADRLIKARRAPGAFVSPRVLKNTTRHLLEMEEELRKEKGEKTESSESPGADAAEELSDDTRAPGGGQIVRDRLKKAASDKTAQAAATRLLGLVGPWGKAAQAALTAGKYRKQIVLGLAAFVLLIAVGLGVSFAIIGGALASPKGNGTTAQQPLSSDDSSAVDSTLNGGAPRVKTSGSAGSCNGITPCLDVEPITERIQSHCGRVSALMAIMYVNKGQGTTYFDENRFISIQNGIKVDRSGQQNCLADGTMDRMSPPDRRGWRHISWTGMTGATADAKKDRILAAVKRSLSNNDPVVMYFNEGGTYQYSKHIVVVVGYDANDEPDQGGTFLINNPAIHPSQTKVKSKVTDKRNIKLTAAWIKKYLGGVKPPYETSVVIRRNYVQ